MAEFVNDDGVVRYAPDFLDDIGLSVHYLIMPDGRKIRGVGDDFVAWHAKGYNHSSIGIELLVEGVWDYAEWRERIKLPTAYNRAQWNSAAKLVAELCGKYDIPMHRVTTHHLLDIRRKFDPGEGFGFAQFMIEVEYYIGHWRGTHGRAGT
jgi:N-acetyl-anhydromuramyl-L-alanine amidase AmpD